MVTPVRLNSLNVESLTRRIDRAAQILLSTHRQCDGDGLGAMLGLYHALKKSGKDVRIVTVDAVPKKYSFLDSERYIEAFDTLRTPLSRFDLVLIFDTNDRRLVEPLFTELEKHCRDIVFVDHHPILNEGPEPTPGSFIDTTAASTGEIAYFLIRGLGIRLDERIARALYTSLAFDTQIFRFVKNSANTHLICAELLQFERGAEKIHRHLFANYTRSKVTYLGKVLSEVEYIADDRVAILNLSQRDLDAHELEMDDSRDVIDMIMNINTVEAAALFREEGTGVFKMSLRSKGHLEILSIAESLGGGGHLYSAGALVKGPYTEIKAKVVKLLLARLDQK
jgi:bifunctional oligoribonuclease and PAP phosphatase NrnA